jgi:hypothetical protein
LFLLILFTDMYSLPFLICFSFLFIIF